MGSFCENFNIGFTRGLFSGINSNLSFMNFTFPPIPTPIFSFMNFSFPPMPTPNFSFMNFTSPSILGCTNDFESFNSHNYLNNSFPSIFSTQSCSQFTLQSPIGFNCNFFNSSSFMPDWFNTNHLYSMKISQNSSDVACSNDAKALMKKWNKNGRNFSARFYNRVVEISNKIKCNADDLMALMNAESGLKPTARNKSSDATGLIQFLPSTAKDLGTSIEALKNMSAEEQLVYVEKYLVKAKSNAGLSKDSKIDAGTLYALVWLPGKAKKKILAESGDKYYQANKGLDKNKDGNITKEDLKRQLDSKRA